MLKRIKYVSRFAYPMGAADVQAIGEASARHNQEHGVTGVLMTAGGLFFQILEGPAEAVDVVYARIVADPRHKDVLLLGEEAGAGERLFPDWAMKVLPLDEPRATRLEPVRAILEACVQQRAILDRLVGALERAAWNELACGSGR